MTDEIASLRASVERLTAERDEARERVGIELRAHGLDECRARVAAEATIARLAKVVWAARAVDAAACEGPCGFHCPDDCVVLSEIVSPLSEALAALTPEDRRRAGIEG